MTLPSSSINSAALQRRRAYLAGSERGGAILAVVIVLVVLGLVVAALIRYTDLVSGSRARVFMEEKAKIQIAANAFKDKYGAFAGDLTESKALEIGMDVKASGLGGKKSGGDGKVVNDGDIGDESVLFFQNLHMVGMYPCKACGELWGDSGMTPAMMEGEFELKNMFDAPIIVGQSPNWDAYWHWFGKTFQIKSGTALTTGGQVPPSVLAEIDKKTDDGNPGSGNFRVSVAPKTSELKYCTTGMGEGFIDNDVAVGRVYGEVMLEQAIQSGAWGGAGNENCAGSWLLY